MIGASMQTLPVFPALAGRLSRIMEVILHVGAHHAGAMRLLRFLKGNAGACEASGTVVWGPDRLGQMLHGLKPVTALPQGAKGPETARQRAIGRLRLNLEKAVKT